MIQLSSLKEKVSWALVLSIIFYIAAAVIVFAVVLPARSEKARLLGEVEWLRQNEVLMGRLVQEKPALEKELAALKAQTQNMAAQVPSQYDLPAVLEILAKQAVLANVELKDLSHIPLKAEAGAAGGVIPLALEIYSTQAIFSYLELIEHALPSLQLTEAALSYLGDGQFRSVLRADLHVLMVEQAAKSQWRGAAVTVRAVNPPQIRGYGLPFAAVSRFLDNRVKILGVVNKGGQSSALVAKDGVQRWVRVGDRLGEATVSSIFSNGIVLSLDGVLLDLRIGGRQDESA